MKKILKRVFCAVISFALAFLGTVAGVFPATLPVQAEESVITYEQTNVLDDLTNATINGEPFSLTKYNFDSKKQTQVLSFTEYCYSFDEDKQDNYGLYVYVYNPKNLKFMAESPLNYIQFTVGNEANASYTKYPLVYLNCSTQANYEGLFYKFKVALSNAQKQAILSKLNSSMRVYRVSGIELYEAGNLNATEFTVATSYKYSGYAKGYGSDENAENTLTYSSEQSEVLALEVKPTYYRPEGTNGKTEYTQDSLHSVYFAVPNDVLNNYGEMSAVHATWKDAVLAPALVTGNVAVYNAVTEYLGRYLDGGDYWWWSDYNKNNDMPYEIIASRKMGSLENSELATPLWAYNANMLYRGKFDPPARYINYMYMCFYSGDGQDSADDYTVSSSMLQEQMLESKHKYNGTIINGKYSEKIFDSVASSYTDVNIHADETYSLTNAIISKDWWDRLWGYKGDVSTTTFNNIPAIYAVKQSDLSGSAEEISKRLYIAESDYLDFKLFYEANKENSTIYLFRYQQSEYVAMEAASWKTDKGSFWEGDGIIPTYKPDRIDSNNYFFQETVNLDFDIIDVTFSNDETETVIPVVSSPIDVIPDATPPVITISDGEIPWWKILIVVILALLLLAVLSPVLSPIIKFLVWLVCLPFKAIGKFLKWLWRKRKRDDES